MVTITATKTTSAIDPEISGIYQGTWVEHDLHNRANASPSCSTSDKYTPFAGRAAVARAPGHDSCKRQGICRWSHIPQARVTRAAAAIGAVTSTTRSTPPTDDHCDDNGGMPVRLHHIVIDTHDLPMLARFWTQALGWQILSEREHEIVIGTEDTAPVGICFMPVTDVKTVKNRIHLDLTTSSADRDAEIERLLALGARRVDVGQAGNESWTVLADPEGNEFCVVRPKETLTR
jgi:predicted enzyme related to lactoylglutathione lyase